jgi:hypothetical protein
MTVDEALAVIESILDKEPLNDVQELIFRQCWEGRQSYEEIAAISRYDDEYIKSTGYKLWKMLSEAFGEKVKKNNLKSVLKRHLRRTQVNIQRNLTIEVTLAGANFSGANLSGTRLFVNLNEADFVQSDLGKTIIPGEHEISEKNTAEEDKQETSQKAEEQSYDWNGWHFRSEEEVEIAEALDRAGVLFIPKSRIRMTTSEGKQNQEPDFLIFSQGKWGILQVWHEDEEKDRESAIAGLQIFQSHGIQTVQHYYASRCQIEPDRVVQEFLETLTSAE